MVPAAGKRGSIRVSSTFRGLVCLAGRFEADLGGRRRVADGGEVALSSGKGEFMFRMTPGANLPRESPVSITKRGCCLLQMTLTSVCYIRVTSKEHFRKIGGGERFKRTVACFESPAAKAPCAGHKPDPTLGNPRIGIWRAGVVNERRRAAACARVDASAVTDLADADPVAAFHPGARLAAH